MIANRPDWCISRQRVVGRADPGARLPRLRHVLLTHGARRAGRRGLRRPRRRRLVRAAARRVRARRASPARRAAAPRSSARRNILDVWFDSGSSHEAVLAVRPGPDAGRPTSTSKAATSTAAGSTARCSSASARAAGRRSSRCITHGFVVDERRPQDVEVARQHRRAAGRHQAAAAPRSSACGCRWSTTARTCGSARRSWRASSRPIASSATRCAYLLANLYDFDPARDRVPIERHAGGRSLRAGPLRGGGDAELVEAYDAFDFQAIVHTLDARSPPSTSARSTSTCRRTASTPSAPLRRRAARPRPRCS